MSSSLFVVSPQRTLVQAWFSIHPWKSQAFPFHEPPGMKATGISKSSSLRGWLNMPFNTWWASPSPPTMAMSEKSISFSSRKYSSTNVSEVVTTFKYSMPTRSSLGLSLVSKMVSALRFPPIGLMKHRTLRGFPYLVGWLIDSTSPLRDSKSSAL